MRKEYTEPEAQVVSFEVTEDILASIGGELSVVSTVEH